MAKRPDNATVDLKIRMKEFERQIIEEAAKKNGRSMNAEVLARLNQSFGENLTERLIYGDESIAAIVRVMAGSFSHGGRVAATLRGHPEWEPKEWIEDEHCFLAAAARAYTSVLSLNYDFDDDDKDELLNVVTLLVAAKVAEYLKRGDSVDEQRDDNETREE